MTTNSLDPRQLPTSEVKSTGSAIARFLRDDESDNVIEICRAFYSELGFIRGRGMYFDFEAHRSRWDVQVEVVAYSDMDDFKFKRVRFTETYDLNDDLDMLGVKVLNDLRCILHTMIRDFTNELFMSRHDNKYRDAFWDLLAVSV